MSGSFIYNRLVASPGNPIYLGIDGGYLLVSPPGNPSSALTLAMMKAKVWHLLRENGPDNGFAEPTINSDFPAAVVTRDLNIGLGNYISDTGLAPSISDRVDTFPVFALLDYPLPADLLSITRIEYNPAGGQIYPLQGKSFQEFDEAVGYRISPQIGQPAIYREPFAGYLRLYPQPGPGQATGNGPGVGTFYINGSPTVGDTVSLTVTNGLTPVTLNYSTIPGDSAYTIAAAIAILLNASSAVQGSGAFMGQTMSNGNQVPLNARSQGSVFFSGAVGTSATPPTLTVDPTTATAMIPVADTMTFYYSSSGRVLVNPGDTPGIPTVFHVAPVYRVLADYWDRKNDAKQSEKYFNKYLGMVKLGKAFVFDVNRSTQPTTAGGDADGFLGGANPGIW